MYFKILFLLSTAAHVLCDDNAKECIPRQYQSSTICVCNSTYCDTIPPVKKISSSNYLVYTTNKAGLRFHKNLSSFEASKPSEFDTVIYIDDSKYHQKFIGWGGAITDAAGININSLSPGAQTNLLRSYFSEEGTQYNMVRVPMGGTDFSTHAYTYDDGPEDKPLKNFKLADEDHKYKIPIIKRILNMSSDEIRLFTSTWGAPKWMKTNNAIAGIGALKPSMYQSWAVYFRKFLEAYKNEGLTFWALTTGNEPLSSKYHVKLCQVDWTPQDQSDWTHNNLIPVIKNSEFASTDIIILDDVRAYILESAISMFSNKSISKFLPGIALHWYVDNLVQPVPLDEVHEMYPDKYIFCSESSFVGNVNLGSWDKAEFYAADILQDVNNWNTGWVEWNLALNLQGGPTYINNYVDASIIVNATADEFYKQPTYYSLGHFSKFIPRGSVRIRSLYSDRRLRSVAVKRPDNGVVLVVLNKHYNAIPIFISTPEKRNISMTLTPKSITTVLYWPN